MRYDNGRCEIRFDITDNGVGVTKEQLTRLFEPFEQAEKSTTRNYGGTGLGLPISKRIVEMMGGTITVASEPGKGSTFSFTIIAEKPNGNPRAIVIPANGEARREPRTEDCDFSGCRVLLAEDMEINREILIALLAPTRLEIECAENGAEALRMFGEAPGRYRMIFMDVHMPEMDGYEATRRIRALGSDEAKAVPIIAMTANVFREDVERCLAAGMNGHLGKPVERAHIIAALKKYLA
jgi:CheY-like chemotaxis protein